MPRAKSKILEVGEISVTMIKLLELPVIVVQLKQISYSWIENCENIYHGEQWCSTQRKCGAGAAEGDRPGAAEDDDSLCGAAVEGEPDANRKHRRYFPGGKGYSGPCRRRDIAGSPSSIPNSRVPVVSSISTPSSMDVDDAEKYSLLKKMWMLYAQEHWTKSYDLKSAVERLYEELGALEFDADHEAIYGMERYYTVQQCEELRDKYKIGRKVCRKFLQGKACSQCLVKRISEIGLRHFLDTVNKYIKDCSDSSSSSDEEVFKAVEQNGEETTEEEE
ncbi:hypothetical protein FQA39_LY05924 [Lamprigera yunnana]|nr:hypothetical protein FQA39_LY05924 [Lamprigera yunnana]